MKKPFFTGVCTALVTPFLSGEVNYPMLERLLRYQMDAGIRCVVISGTTGEAPTLSDGEKLELIRRAKEFVGSDCLIIAGTGTNCTEHSVALSRAAEAVGADGLLLVSPYYNKSTPDGLIAHYSAIASSVHIPCILYNVPGRTGQDIPMEVYKALSQVPNITGVKEASGNMSQVVEIAARCGDKLDIYSGDDALTVPMMSMGGVGCISVLSNVMPALAVEMCDRFFNGDVAGAAEIQCRTLPLVNALFSEVNPIPAKAAVAAMGFGQEYVRMPLTLMEDATRQNLYAQMRKLGVLK